MAIYEAFNSNGISVVVSDVDLDQVARSAGPLSTELADAAAQARRTDLVEQLRGSLDGADRARKLAAAKALLASVVANSFIAVTDEETMTGANDLRAVLSDGG